MGKFFSFRKQKNLQPSPYHNPVTKTIISILQVFYRGFVIIITMNGKHVTLSLHHLLFN